MWSNQHAVALRKVFVALNEHHLKWMVLRNYEGLPERNSAKDVDILVCKQDFDKARNAVAKALREDGFQVFCTTRFQYASCSTFFNIASAQPLSLKIDLMDGFVWRGAQVVSFGDLFSNKVVYKDFFVPDPAHDAFMLWVKPLMTGGFIKQSYKADILRGLSMYPDRIRAIMGRTFGEALTNEVWPYLANGRLEQTVRFKKSLCHAAWYRSLRREPLSTLTSAFEHVCREVARRFRRPRGTMIAVIGPDGAGKTTFIELLRAELVRCLVKNPVDVKILHFRPNVFPNIKRLFAGASYDPSSEMFSQPHRAIPAGLMSSLLRQLYYWADYMIGYWGKLRQECIAGKIIVFDRYVYDFLADPHRSRIALPTIVRRQFVKAAPQPDIVFLLHADASTIYGRKTELTLEEIERQLNAYRAIATRSKRFIILDGEQQPARICRDALRRFITRSFTTL